MPTKIDRTTEWKVDISGLDHRIPHPFEAGRTSAIVTDVVLHLYEFSEPLDDGDYFMFDYCVLGYDCTAKGERDKRQTRVHRVSFNGSVKLYEFLIGLLEETEESKDGDYTIARMTQYANKQLARAREYEAEKFKELLAK